MAIKLKELINEDGKWGEGPFPYTFKDWDALQKQMDVCKKLVASLYKEAQKLDSMYKNDPGMESRPKQYIISTTEDMVKSIEKTMNIMKYVRFTKSPIKYPKIPDRSLATKIKNYFK